MDNKEMNEEMNELVENIQHMLDNKPETLQSINRLLRLLYMSETGELQGANSVCSYEFNQCQVKVFYGQRER